QNHAARDVPYMVVESVKCVESARRDVCEIESSRTGTAQRLSVEGEIAPPIEGLIAGAHVGREARRQERMSKRRRNAGLQAFAIEPGAMAVRCREHFLARRFIDDTNREFTSDLQTDRDAVERI